MEIWRYEDGTIANSCAMGYVVISYPLALYGLAGDSAVLYMLSVILLAHALIIAAYLVHECMHQTLFKNSRHNQWLGEVLSWVTGAAYARYADLKKKHLRHHADRIDSLAVDYHELLARYELLRRAVSALQYWHIPAVEILTHGLSMAAPFMLESRRDQRLRVMLILLTRIIFFAVLLWWDWKIIPGYLLAYLLFMLVLGFMDTFQHRYLVRFNLDDDKSPPEFDRAYEETHTWSNLISEQYRWLNLLVLNFCYHNMHHYKSGEPWYRLPRLHQERYQKNEAPVISIRKQWHDFHQYRMHRIMDAKHSDMAVNPGAAGVSFLVGV